jgi:hypothetical protein
MQHTTDVPTPMAMPLAVTSDLLTTAPPATAWGRLATLLHSLQMWMTMVTRYSASARRAIRPDYPRQETPTELVARKYTFLYAKSLSG